MKRGSNLLYVCTSTPTKTSFRRKPIFKFSEKYLPKLVDYSFSEESDSGNDSEVSLNESWDRLQISLDSLTASFASLDTSSTPLKPVEFSRHLHERASLRLTVERSKEEVRKNILMNQVRGSIKKSNTKWRSVQELTGAETEARAGDGRRLQNPKTKKMKRQVKSLPLLDCTDSTVNQSVVVCEAEKPAKRRKLDFKALTKLASRRFSFKARDKGKRHKQRFDSPQRNCLFSCFIATGSYSLDI